MVSRCSKYCTSETTSTSGSAITRSIVSRATCSRSASLCRTVVSSSAYSVFIASTLHALTSSIATSSTELTEAVVHRKKEVTSDICGAAVGSCSRADVSIHLIALIQYVIGPHCDSEVAFRKQSLADLEIPNQFIGIHGGLGISSSAALVYFGLERHVPGEIHYSSYAIAESVCVKVAGTGVCASAVVIVNVSLSAYFEPIVAVADSQPLTNSGSSGTVLYGFLRAVLVNISHRICESTLCIGIEVETHVA